MNDTEFLKHCFNKSLPKPPVKSLVAWAEKNVSLPGSALSAKFNSKLTPWLKEPMERISEITTRIVDVIFPVQSGKSTIGEVAMAWYIVTQTSGDIFYLWPTDDKAITRFKKRTRKILQSCEQLKSIWPEDRSDNNQNLVIFPHLNLSLLGTFNPDNLDSDSVRFLVNEEIHSWEPGRLGKAYRRTSAFWNSLILNLSTAGNENDQLHQSFKSSTQQHWQWKCPSCNKYHIPKVEKNKNVLGGLIYDNDKSKNIDWEKIRESIVYEFPCCGHQIKDEPRIRNWLADTGRYTEPLPGSDLTHRGYTMTGICSTGVSWFDMVKEKIEAVYKVSRGDVELLKRYLQERESIFWSETKFKENKKEFFAHYSEFKKGEGMKDYYKRFMSIDYQGGEKRKNETSYFWFVIRDFDQSGNSLLVDEGRIETENELIDIQSRYSIPSTNVAIDSGFSADYVYQLCFKYGWLALKGDKPLDYSHKNKDGTVVKRSYAEIKFQPTNFGNNNGGPTSNVELLIYSKHGIREKYHYLTDSEINFEIPVDVSNEYKEHQLAEERIIDKNKLTGEETIKWIQREARNDLFVCELYNILQFQYATDIIAEYG